MKFAEVHFYIHEIYTYVHNRNAPNAYLASSQIE